MKQRTFVLAALAMMPFAVAVAQTPPTPPVAPTPVTPVTPVTPMTPVTPKTAPTPIGAAIPLLPPGQYIDSYQMEEIRRAADEARREAQRAMEDSRWEIQKAQEDARRAMKDVRVELPHFDYTFGHNFGQNFGQNFALAAPVPGQSGVYSVPKGQYQWIQGDPADSLYQLGQEAMGRYDYSRAAARYAEVIAKYPSSRRFAQAVYYQAFSQFRVGTLESLRAGLKVLETNQSRLLYEMRSNNDAPALQARILRALAERNEAGAEAKLRDLYAKYPTSTCDTENTSIQSQVLNSYYQSDPDGAMPYIRTALTKRDACSAELRKTAVMLLGNRPTEDKAALLIQVAKTDTVREVRTRAVEILARMPGDAATNALMELMRDPDESVQRSAVRALTRSDNPRARVAMKTAMLERRDAPESQRLEAIRSFDRDNMTQDDALYLRNLFNRKDESERIKEQVLSVLSQVPSEDNIKFLLDVAKNPNESSRLRSRALSTVTRTSLSVDELIKIYDATDSRPMRKTLVEGMSNRREQAALNKLLEIAKCSTDPEVRGYTVQVLLNKNDKAVTEQVLNLMSSTGAIKCS